jgi:hypothetical protein
MIYKKAFLYRLTHHPKEGMSVIFIFLQKIVQRNDKPCLHVTVIVFSDPHKLLHRTRFAVHAGRLPPAVRIST